MKAELIPTIKEALQTLVDRYNTTNEVTHQEGRASIETNVDCETPDVTIVFTNEDMVSGSMFLFPIAKLAAKYKIHWFISDSLGYQRIAVY